MTRNVSSLSDRHNGNKLTRQSNIELLRIIAMIMIVAHHFAVHSGFSFSTETITLNRLWVQFIQIGGKIGVNVFVFISGFFLISTTSLKINKVLRLLLQMLTYSVLLFCVFVGLDVFPFETKNLVKSILPVTSSLWWFASAYFVLYLISPYINKLLNALDKKTYQRLLVLLTFSWCLVPTFFRDSWQCNNLLWFVYLYSLSGYIRLHFRSDSLKGSKCIAVSGALIILTYLSAVAFDVLGTKNAYFASLATYFYDMKRLPILLISLTLFVGFLRIKIKPMPLINVISSATFGVYLIHDNMFVRPFIWKTVFKNASYSDSNLLIPYSLVVIAAVFLICTVIELLRQYAIEKRYLKVIDKVSARLAELCDKFFSLKVFDKL